MPTKKPRLCITLDPEVHEQIKKMALRKNENISAVGRDLIEQALNIELCIENMNMICTIIREQLRDTLTPYMTRITAMESKSCIQASATAFLCAETLSKFVPEGKREDYSIAYEKARKKAIKYMQSPVELE